MKKKIIIIILIIIVAAGAAFAYFELRSENLDSNNNNIDSKKVSEKIKEQDNPDGDWKIEQTDDVFAGYSIQEVFGGETVTKTAVGKSPGVDGSMKIDGKIISDIAVNVDMSKLQSSSDRRDDRMKGEALETDKFDIAKFLQSEEFELDAIPEKGEAITVNVKGDLVLHGATVPVTFKLEAIWDGKTIKVSGEQEISLADYEISPPNESFVKVEDKGLIKLQLLFIPA